MKENNKKMIPKGYANEDTDKRLDWLRDKIGFNYDTDLSTTPEDLKGIIENHIGFMKIPMAVACLLYTSPSPRDKRQSRMPSSA